MFSPILENIGFVLRVEAFIIPPMEAVAIFGEIDLTQ
jgi:hypothetical protein